MATEKLHEYIQKVFALDDERLKQGGNRYFRELLQRIRDIRKTNYIDDLFFLLTNFTGYCTIVLSN